MVIIVVPVARHTISDAFAPVGVLDRRLAWDGHVTSRVYAAAIFIYNGKAVSNRSIWRHMIL